MSPTSPAKPVRRGEVWWVAFGPGQGSEIQKTRPAIVVSNDAANRHLDRVQVIPLTTNVSRLFPSEAFVLVNGRQNKAMADQLATVSKDRLSNRFGTISSTDMSAVEQAVRVQLAL